MLSPTFVRDDCKECGGTGQISWRDDYGWHNGDCYNCVGSGRVVRVTMLKDSPWIADVSEEPTR